MLFSMTNEMTQILAQATESSGFASTLWSIFLLVMGFSLVIFVHELGHFIAAKWAGVRVERFAIGFGKELFGFSKGETRYSFNVLPLGGYVKMLGQEDFVVDKSGELKVKSDPTSFTNKPVSKRMVIVSAGVIMNVIFAAIAFAVVVMIGRYEKPPVVGDVAPNSPADRAGLQTGDRIVAINGKELQSWNDLTTTIVLSDPGETLVFDLLRDGEPVEPKPEVRPEFDETASRRQVGIAGGMNRRVFQAAFREIEDPRPDELQAKDKLHQIVLPDGPKAFKNVGVFQRHVQKARGEEVEFVVERPVTPDSLTDEMLVQADLDIESTLQRVKVRATWFPLPYNPGDQVGGSLLGMVPRMTAVIIEEDKAFDKAGVLLGDVITKLGNTANPTYEQLDTAFNENVDEEIPLQVSRPWSPNHDLAGETIFFCVQHREPLIAIARTDPAKALESVKSLATQASLPEAEVEKLTGILAKLADGTEWRRWLENVDIHTMDPVVPKRPFALFSSPPPTVGAMLSCMDEEHLVVAAIEPKLGERISPAQEAGIPEGAIILSAAGKPVRRWYQLSTIFEANAGKTIPVTYRKVDEIFTVQFRVPGSIYATLGLDLSCRILKIDDKESCTLTQPAKEGEDGEELKVEVSLPDWRAVAGILRESVGKTVKVEWVTGVNEHKAGEFAVTENDTDPWQRRIRYAETFRCYPLLEIHPERNPILAIGIGFRKAYEATVATVQSIRHMVFTQQIGVKNVSGPVGILRMGTQFADSGVLDLIWFLAIISANLAVINFLPLPIVDGGLFLFLILEKIRGEPVSIKTQIVTQFIGIALIATLFILVTYQDILNWITGS